MPPRLKWTASIPVSELYQRPQINSYLRNDYSVFSFQALASLPNHLLFTFLHLYFHAVKQDIETKMAQIETALAAALDEKENLTLKSKHATEELGVLRRQLRLLSSSLADAKRRLNEEKAMFQKELSEQGNRLQALVLQQTNTEAAAF